MLPLRGWGSCPRCRSPVHLLRLDFCPFLLFDMSSSHTVGGYRGEQDDATQGDEKPAASWVWHWNSGQGNPPRAGCSRRDPTRGETSSRTGQLQSRTIGRQNPAGLPAFDTGFDTKAFVIPRPLHGLLVQKTTTCAGLRTEARCCRGSSCG